MFPKGTSLDGDHRGLPLGEAAAPEVHGQDIDVRCITLVGDEVGFEARAFARDESAASVEDTSLTVENDGLQKAVLLDVVGQSGQVVLVEQREERGGRMEFDRSLLGAKGERLM